MATKAEAQRARIARRQRDSQVKRYVAYLAIVAGAALIVVAVFSRQSRGTTGAASFDYGPEDVASFAPFQAVHEMGAGPPIPFLPKDGPQPQIALDEVFHDFGRIGPADVVYREFAVANLGEAPLTISRAYTTCGCTTADFTASVIQPGEVTLVTLRFDAGFHDTAGQTVRRGIIIENNDPNSPQAEYWVEAAVRTAG